MQLQHVAAVVEGQLLRGRPFPERREVALMDCEEHLAQQEGDERRLERTRVRVRLVLNELMREVKYLSLEGEPPLGQRPQP